MAAHIRVYSSEFIITRWGLGMPHDIMDLIRLLGANQLREPMLTSCQLGPREENYVQNIMITTGDNGFQNVVRKPLAFFFGCQFVKLSRYKELGI